MAHGFFCTCKKCAPPISDILFGGSGKKKSNNRNNKSQQSREQSAARRERQQQRGSNKFKGGSGTHGDSRTGGGQNNTGRSR